MTAQTRTHFAPRPAHRGPLTAVLALTAGVLLIAGTAAAKYFPDGSVQNGTTGGWVTPNDMVCILGVHTDGTLDIAAGVTNSRDCIYLTVTGRDPVDVTASSMCGSGAAACNVAANCTGTNGTTKGTLTWNATDLKCYDSAPCTVAGFAAGTYGGILFPGNDGAKHGLATSICVDALGNGISLKDLDRTAQMCAAKGGIWKQTSATAPSGFAGTFPTAGFGGACIAYGRQFASQDANGVPLAFGLEGTTTAQAGYCYTSMNWTAVYSTAACPSLKASTAPYDAASAYDWSVASSQCRYAKSIAGKVVNALTNADGTTVAAATYVDLSAYTTMGDCLAHGGTWNNWVGQAATVTAVGSDSNTYKRPGWDYTTQVPDADAGCLHCHSTLTQYNGPAERQKDSYLKTGHKNMLRKVVAGKNWAGPDGVVYTHDTAGHPIDFSAATVAGGALYFIFGDWMAPDPNAVGPLGDTTSYACGACHTTGFNDSTNPGVQSIGTVGYVAVEPVAPYNSNVAAGHKWDIEGINCSRCHNATTPPVAVGEILGGSCSCASAPACTNAGGVFTTSCSVDCTQIYLTQAACTAASGTWTAFGSGTASAFPSTHATGGGMGALATGTGRTNLCFGCHQSIAKNWPAQGGAAGGTTQYDPTRIPTGVSHGAAAGRDFNGHVIGNSFLNSVHAGYAGVNSNTANGGIRLNALGKYDLVDPAGATEYGSFFKGYTCWQSPTSNSPAKTKADGTEIKTKSECESLYGAGSWRADATGDLGTKQGTCSTCHDVHNSLFVAEQEEFALRKTCENCHVNNATTGATDAAAPQVVVADILHSHAGGTPFDTSRYENACVVCHMATQAEENGNQNSMPVHVWRINTDVAYNTFPTTGQFYGGTCSVHSGAVQNAPSLPVVYLSDTSAANCTAATPTAGVWTDLSSSKDRNAQTAPDGTYTKAVWVDLDLACGQCHGGSFGPGETHFGAPYKSKAELAAVAKGIHDGGSVTYQTTFSAKITGLKVDVTAQVNCGDGIACPTLTYDWNWGDGTVSADGGNPASHTYTTYTSKTIVLNVKLAGKIVGTYSRSVTPAAPTVTFTATVTGLKVDVLASASCGGSCPTFTYDWNWGDATTHGSANPGTHTYAAAGTKTVTLTLSEDGKILGIVAKNVSPTNAVPDVAPVASGTCTWDANTWTATIIDTSTDTDLSPVQTVTVEWGDLSTHGIGAAGATFTHTYLKPPTAPATSYPVTIRAIDSALKSSTTVTLTCSAPVAPAYFTISGTVFAKNGTTPLSAASVRVMKGAAIVKTVYTAANGTFSAGSLKPADYTLVVVKPGYTFASPAATATVGSDKNVTISATAP